MSDVAAVAAAVVALAALVVSIKALRWARESARAGRDSATAAAESVRWSQLSAEAAQASARTAVSAEAARVEALAEAAVRWEVARSDDNEVSAYNLGPAIAYEVTAVLSPLSYTGTPISLPTKEEVVPGGTYTFTVNGHDERDEPWVEVRWKVDPAEEGWRRTRRAMPPPPEPTQFF